MTIKTLTPYFFYDGDAEAAIAVYEFGVVRDRFGITWMFTGSKGEKGV
jgi:uncharacterized glyoxalase superfamily protein PhnB